MVPAPPELLVVVGLIALVWGIQKLPDVANAIGRLPGELKKGREQSDD